MAAPTPEISPQPLSEYASGAVDRAFGATSTYIAARETAQYARTRAATALLELPDDALYYYELTEGDGYYRSHDSNAQLLPAHFFGQIALSTSADTQHRVILPDAESRNHLFTFPLVPSPPDQLQPQRQHTTVALALSRSAFADRRLKVVTLDEGRALVAAERVFNPLSILGNLQ